ncbi:MAG TPA: prepilin peptidase [Candidatus Methylomirabilis sp.]|nr:prepilin peptidase [Candidatus Methylomirabilis sp.]
MLALPVVLILLLGAALGSFANVLVVRIKEGSSIGGRSRCPSCRKTIRAKHLIPVVSWLWLKGRCAMCRKPIHWQYPAVETAMAVLAVVAFLRHLDDPSQAALWAVAFELAVSFCFLVITAFDLRWQLVPLEFTAASAMLVGAGRTLMGDDWLRVALGAVTVAVVLGFFVLASRGALMGEGDPVVGLLVGAALGFPLALAGIVVSFVIGGSVAAALLVQGSVTRKTPVPFAPFLAAGTLVALWYAEPIGSYLQFAFM